MGEPHCAQYMGYSVRPQAPAGAAARSERDLDGVSFAETLGVEHDTGGQCAQHGLVADIPQLDMLDAIDSPVGAEHLEGRARGNAAKPLPGNNDF